MKHTLVFIFCLLPRLPICLAADTPRNDPQSSVERITIEGRTMRLKVPAQRASGKPWLWVGEFAGHLGSLEDGLVAKGWHVAWVDVSNQFGSPRAMAVWEKSGGRFKIFPKEGGDHHSHGLPDPAPLIELLCKEAGTKPAK